MDAIEILGGLLGGGKSGGGGLGGAILGQILKGATGGSPQPAPRQSAPPQSSGRVTTRVESPGNLQQDASELEDLLNVAKNRNQQRTQTPAPQQLPRSVPQSVPQLAPQQKLPQSSSPFAKPASRTPSILPQRRDPINNPQQQNEDAIILIRAMINAAKSDGDISDAEQKSILERIGNPDQDAIDFLNNEFSQPLDVREFAWSVPLGLEQKVYTMSLASIELDVNQEATYLRELAHGLRLTPDACKQIHQQFGAPEIF